MAHLIEPVMGWIGIVEPKIVHGIAFILGFSIITFLHITLGEQAPKYAAIQYPRSFTMAVAMPLRLFYIIFRPFIFVLNTSANLMLKAVGIAPGDERGIIQSEEEIRLMIADGRRSGVIDATEFKLIENIFEFTETTVKEIMVPRPDVFALNIHESFAHNWKLAIDSGYTRIPVFRDSIDSIIGILYVKDLFKIDRQTMDTILESILRPVYFVPEATSINRLMQDLLQQKMHLGVVIDEFGGTSGIVTLEDIIEKIVGEIQDEYDDERNEIEAQADGSFIVSPSVSIDDFNKYFKAVIPEDTNYKTLAGFLNNRAGHIPHLAEKIIESPFTFTITKKTPKRIQQVRVELDPAFRGKK
jgi:CBS domain containing-hemolysin-like protein